MRRTEIVYKKVFDPTKFGIKELSVSKSSNKTGLAEGLMTTLPDPLEKNVIVYLDRN